MSKLRYRSWIEFCKSIRVWAPRRRNTFSFFQISLCTFSWSIRTSVSLSRGRISIPQMNQTFEDTTASQSFRFPNCIWSSKAWLLPRTTTVTTPLPVPTVIMMMRMESRHVLNRLDDDDDYYRDDDDDQEVCWMMVSSLSTSQFQLAISLPNAEMRSQAWQFESRTKNNFKNHFR